jgi:aldehyde dehydrogenase (NAD+)
MTTLHANLIDGAWVEGEAAPNINPSNTNDIIGTYARATRADAQAAIAAAKRTFPKWRARALGAPRGLRKAADEILARKDELGRLLSREEGKSLAEGVGENGSCGSSLRFLRGRNAPASRRNVALCASGRRGGRDA